MEEIKQGIVFSDDLRMILNGINAFDYRYEYIPSDSVINDVRDDFKMEVRDIFNGDVVTISEEEMMEVNRLFGGESPHCYIR